MITRNVWVRLRRKWLVPPKQGIDSLLFNIAALTIPLQIIGSSNKHLILFHYTLPEANHLSSNGWMVAHIDRDVSQIWLTSTEIWVKWWYGSTESYWDMDQMIWVNWDMGQMIWVNWDMGQMMANIHWNMGEMMADISWNMGQMMADISWNIGQMMTNINWEMWVKWWLTSTEIWVEWRWHQLKYY